MRFIQLSAAAALFAPALTSAVEEPSEVIRKRLGNVQYKSKTEAHFAYLGVAEEGSRHLQDEDMSMPATCEFCRDGLDDPAFVLPTNDEATCEEAAAFAGSLSEGDAACDTVKLAESFCCTVAEDCQSIVDIAVGNPDFSTLVAAVTAADLVDALSGDGPLTVFAPTNDAFAALPEGTVETLLLPENIGTLTDILTYHVVAAEVLSTDLVNGDVETLNGASVTVNLDDGVKINDSNVITADIQACNGVIHVIDAVLLPPAEPEPEPETLPEEDMSMSMPECQGIVDIAVGNPDFSTLVAAVTAAGLVDALSGDGPLTVFAPTNDAFAALPEGTVETLLLPENIGQLTDILTYHVVAAEAPSSSLSDGDVETLNGATVAITVSDDGVTVNNANVIIPDIMACNGIIHVIDAVLLPPMDMTPEEEAPAEEEGAPAEGGDAVASAKAEKEPGMMGGKSGKAKSSKAKTLKETPMAKTTKVEKAEEAVMDAKAEKISKSSKQSKSSKAKSVKAEKVASEKAAGPKPKDTKAEKAMSTPTRRLASDAYLGIAEEGSRHLQDMSMSMPECQGIVDIAVGNPDFSTLVAAVSAAGLVDALSGDGPLTVFAPTNDAFAALPEGTVETLLLPENIDALTGILTYHVVAAEVLSTDLANGDVETLNGASVTVNLDDGVKINDSNVIIPDIIACNGVIHVIDAVLLPPAEEEEAPAEEEEAPAEGGDAPVASAKAEKEPSMMVGKSGKAKSSKAKTLKETPMAKTTKVEKAEEAEVDAKAEKISKSSKQSKSSKAKAEKVASEKMASTKAEKMAPTRQLLLRR